MDKHRLGSELMRLYSAAAEPGPTPGSVDLVFFDAQGRVRALVLELGRPADWPALATVWQGVQGDLGLPAPAVAVQGRDAFQLWFSLARPVSAQAGHGFLAALAARYLGDIAAHRLRLLPAADPALPPPDRHAAPVPQRVADGQWSAFVSADLAPMFSDTPWLDTAPNLDGQAGLLAGLTCTQPDAWQQALARLMPAPAAGIDTGPRARESGETRAHAGTAGDDPQPDPRQFLLGVMNDDNQPMHLRIEAAKALLPCTTNR